jgi:hypothetical protein
MKRRTQEFNKDLKRPTKSLYMILIDEDEELLLYNMRYTYLSE